jgi:hypothetical protein
MTANPQTHGPEHHREPGTTVPGSLGTVPLNYGIPMAGLFLRLGNIMPPLKRNDASNTSFT